MSTRAQLGTESSQPRVVLVTGSSRGIGRDLVEHYIQRGDRVIGCARSASDFEAPGYRHVRLDVCDESAVSAMFSEIRREHGGLDVLINNAGIAAMNHALLTPMSSARKICETNFLGTFLFCRNAARLMRKRRWGRIVNFVTIAVPMRLSGEAVYAASKAAVVSLTEILARELAELGITVNAIGPGIVDTELTRGVPREKLGGIIARQAIARGCELRDLTNVIDFFLRRQSDFVTGQTIYLGGVNG